MFLVYYIAMVAVGAPATDWVNDGVFGDGFHLFGNGTAAYEQAAEEYGDSDQILQAFIDQYGTEDMADAIDLENEDYSQDGAAIALSDLVNATPDNASVTYETEDEETLETTEHPNTTKQTSSMLLTNTKTHHTKRTSVLRIRAHTAFGLRVSLFFSANSSKRLTHLSGFRVLCSTVL